MKYQSIILLFILLLSSLNSALGNEKLTSINVVAQEWTGQTNADGSGLYFELLKEIYTPVGITVNTSIVPFERAVMMLRKKCTDASVGFYSAEDAKIAGWYFYITPQHPIDFENVVAIFKKGSVPKWKYPQSLTNRKVTWIQGYTYEKNIQADMVYQPVSGHKQAWELLGMGRIDFYLESEVDATTSALENGVDLSEYQFETLWINNLYVPFSKTAKGQQLMEIFDHRMVVMRNTGELSKLYKKWKKSMPPSQ